MVDSKQEHGFRTDMMICSRGHFCEQASPGGHVSLYQRGHDFKEYCMSHEIKHRPEKLYLSLGDREAKCRNKMLMTVQDNTEALVAYYKEIGIDVTWELNPGNHFKDAALRSAKGIMAII